MSKTTDVYRNLQKHLNKLPIGFPQTKSGVEIKILKLLFTPKEAEIAVKLKMMPETIRPIYRRVKKKIDSKQELKELLNSMDEKGAISGKRKGKRIYYRNAMFIIGIYEFQVNRMTDEFMTLMHQYIEEAFGEEILRTNIHQLRTVPVEKSISNESQVYTYDNILRLIKKVSGPFGVAECVCRTGHDLIGQSCKQTGLRESCLVFGQTARYHINHGYARPINREESLEILRRAEDAGLVLQPGNSKRLGFICTCCGCCCEGLLIVNRFPRPAEFYTSSYQASVDSLTCSGCKTCIKRCQMKAISIQDDVAQVDLDRCIGCGLCVPTCPTNAMNLVKKIHAKKPPRGHFRLILRITRRKEGNWAALKLILRTLFSLKLYYILKKK